ncbi:MAG TPA: ABC transporter substrate-binding protein [Alphaproteobacteria bacterium]|nr:ABC transporter substrate-binding protein [Alphaproteobacteria bacterium]
MRALMCACAALAAFGVASPVPAAEVSIPVLVPITGFLSLEGTSQRNGAMLAIRNAPPGLNAHADVADTGTAPDVAVNALERALGREAPTAIVASMLGTQVLAMLPIAFEHKVPLLTVSGTASVTEKGNPYVFRFFPGDAITKVAHVRYAAEALKAKRLALIAQTTEYGQSGRAAIEAIAGKLGLDIVFEESVDVQLRDLSPVLGKVRATKPDVLLLHLHAGPTALAVRQAAAMNLDIPIVAGSALHQPTTAALLEPAELRGVCAETNASPVSGGSPEMERFLQQYREQFKSEPDGYALGQYDGVMMALQAAAKGATAPATLTAALSSATYRGLAMTYKSDGKGNMAHSAIIVCYDGNSRVPRIAKRYDDIDGVLAR